MVRKRRADPEEQEPTEVAPTASPFNNWDTVERIIKILQPVMLGVLTVITLWIGQKAGQAADVARANDDKRAVLLDSIVKVQDTVHTIVNSQRTAMESLQVRTDRYNVQLIEQLRRHKLVPVVRERP